MRRPLHMALRGVFSQMAPVSCPSYPAYSSRWVFTFLQDVCLKDRRISWDSSSRTLLANFLRVEFLGGEGSQWPQEELFGLLPLASEDLAVKV